ncbi:MAG: symmetrical bis(5'-nucleosyl)-tetraphosphatase [Steroidobacteraceae bacterium]
MATWAIGDVQGCAAELEALLDRIGYSPARDRLWFVGDLVNRGPRSLDVLRLLCGLDDSAVVVLGNHDLHLLALARHGALREGDAALAPVLAAPDRGRLLDWLQSRPMLHHDEALGLTMLHAGVPPQWDLGLARRCAADLERVLRGETSGAFFDAMYGNQPDLWSDDLAGIDRLRFTVNALTRLRVCDAEGRMLLKLKGPPARLPAGAMPWFRAPGRRTAAARIVCGHWSALGYHDGDGILALDTGCVWGGPLTARRLDAAGDPVRVTSGQPVVTFDD